jgi:CubicO group peptidase (beta-lactamase class C family)
VKQRLTSLKTLFSIIFLGSSILCQPDAHCAEKAVATRRQNAAHLPPEPISRIETFIQSEKTRLRIPGLSIAIAIDYRLEYANGFRIADLENSVPATPATVYRTPRCQPGVSTEFYLAPDRGVVIAVMANL